MDTTWITPTNAQTDRDILASPHATWNADDRLTWREVGAITAHLAFGLAAVACAALAFFGVGGGGF